MIKISSTILFLLLFASCGRKNNFILDFTQNKDTEKINRLTLPTIQGFKIKKETDKKIFLLSWKKVTPSSIDQQIIGYNVYAFNRNAFIPKKPCNKQPILTTNLTISIPNNSENRCYLVRCIFSIKNKLIEGPASKIICP